MSSRQYYNVWNGQDVRTYIDRIADEDDRLCEYLWIILNKSLLSREENLQLATELPQFAPEWLKNKWDICGPFHTFVPDPALGSYVRTLADWLRVEMASGAQWTGRVNDRGIPKKLYHLNLETALLEAERVRKKGAPVEGGQTEVVEALDNGFSIVRLLDKEAMRHDGLILGHCLKNPDSLKKYNFKREQGISYFSLRDRNGRSCATFQVDEEEGVFSECNGEGGCPPAREDMDPILAFIDARRFSVMGKARDTGLVIQDDKRYSIYDLPEELIHDGPLDLSGVHIPFRLPRKLIVRGALILDKAEGLTELPAILQAESLSMNECPSIEKIDGEFHVRYGISMSRCANLREVRGRIVVGNALYCNQSPRLEVFDTDFVSRSGLDLSWCPSLRKLSGSYAIGNWASFEGTPVESWPESFRIIPFQESNNLPLPRLGQG